MNPSLRAETLTGFQAWLDTLIAMLRKELTIMLRYPVAFVSSFGEIFLIVTIFILAGLMFAPGGVQAAGGRSAAGLVIYGFILHMYFSEALWGIGYNIRREQTQGTLEQLYLSPASRLASLLSRVSLNLFWTSAVTGASVVVMRFLIGRLPFENWPLGLGILLLTLSGTTGAGFAFAALTLRIRESGSSLANALGFAFIILCAPFFPFAALPEGLQAVSRAIPLAYAVDAFRSTLMGFPAGFPELAPIEVELLIVGAFGLLMPVVGYWLYWREASHARRTGSLSEY